jgi:adenylosuccinate lyase
VLAGLEVHEGAMRANLALTHGLVLSERLVFELAERIGQAGARALVSEAAARAAERGTPLRDELAADRRVPLSAGELDAAFDPGTYTGAADVFVDRALELYRSSR